MNYYLSVINKRESLTMRISSFVPFDCSFDDAGRSDEVHGDDIGRTLPLAIIPIRNIDINFLCHLTNTSKPI